MNCIRFRKKNSFHPAKKSTDFHFLFLMDLNIKLVLVKYILEDLFNKDLKCLYSGNLDCECNLFHNLGEDGWIFACVETITRVLFVTNWRVLNPTKILPYTLVQIEAFVYQIITAFRSSNSVTNTNKFCKIKTSCLRKKMGDTCSRNITQSEDPNPAPNQVVKKLLLCDAKIFIVIMYHCYGINNSVKLRNTFEPSNEI